MAARQLVVTVAARQHLPQAAVAVAVVTASRAPEAHAVETRVFALAIPKDLNQLLVDDSLQHEKTENSCDYHVVWV